MARPRKQVDIKLLEKLAFIHLPTMFIADCLGISHDTLNRRFASIIKEQQSNGKAKLLSKAWSKVEQGDWNAIKFLLQNLLKMSDKIETESTEKIIINIDGEDAKL